MRRVETRRLDYLTAPAVQEYLRRGDAAILALGPTEAHGLHAPLGCDYLISLATAELAARQADALVLPPFAYSWPGATAKLPSLTTASRSVSPIRPLAMAPSSSRIDSRAMVVLRLP